MAHRPPARSRQAPAERRRNTWPLLGHQSGAAGYPPRWAARARLALGRHRSALALQLLDSRTDHRKIVGGAGAAHVFSVSCRARGRVDADYTKPKRGSRTNPRRRRDRPCSNHLGRGKLRRPRPTKDLLPHGQPRARQRDSPGLDHRSLGDPDAPMQAGKLFALAPSRSTSCKRRADRPEIRR